MIHGSFWRGVFGLAATALIFDSSRPHAHGAMSWVTVGNPGNVDTTGTTAGGLGSVADEYRIGQFEVTIGQYCTFLNDVAQNDPYGLYNLAMGTNANVAGIARSGLPGAYRYKVLENQGASKNRPITYVSWFDAARYVNWLVSGSTENGAYLLLNGTTSSPMPVRSSTASFFIPTQSEWYKAAYYSPTLNSGTGGYWSYATQSNSPPGNQIGPLPNQANVKVNGLFSVTQEPGPVPAQNYLTDVGSYTSSSSYYRTFDQTGNAWEWTETGTSTNQRVRGGSWKDDTNVCAAANTANASVLTENDRYGFRVASKPLALPWPETEILIDVPLGITWTQSQAGHPLLAGVRPVKKIGGGALVLDQSPRLQLLGSFTIQSGTLKIGAKIRDWEVGELVLTADALLDVNKSKVVALGLSPTAVVEAIRSGRGDGSWNGSSGITSSGSGGGVGWKLDDDKNPVIAFAMPGDTNLDWDIDIIDIVNLVAESRWQLEANWDKGDFNYDGIFDILDVFELIKADGYGKGPYNSAEIAVTAVPEPGALLMVGLVIAAAAVWPLRAASSGICRIRVRSET